MDVMEELRERLTFVSELRRMAEREYAAAAEAERKRQIGESVDVPWAGARHHTTKHSPNASADAVAEHHLRAGDLITKLADEIERAIAGAALVYLTLVVGRAI